MIIVPESAVAELVSLDDCVNAVEKTFVSMAERSARNFPVVREAIGYENALFGFKSGFDQEGLTLGLKAGGFWPNNTKRDLTNHQSTVFLFDPDTGRCSAVVGGNLLTALRTAAASAISIKHLARQDAKVLGMVGAGHQASFQLRAAVRQRQFEKVVAWNYHPEMLPRLAAVAEELGIPFESVELDRLGAEADVIITITSSFQPLLTREQIRPGTHLACMGTDTKGKQEVDPLLFVDASLFSDEIAQAISIGESQHAVAQGLVAPMDIVEIGAVIGGQAPGRVSEGQVTLFDGTGVGLQDLAVAQAVVELAVAKGVALDIAL